MFLMRKSKLVLTGIRKSRAGGDQHTPTEREGHFRFAKWSVLGIFG